MRIVNALLKMGLMILFIISGGIVGLVIGAILFALMLMFVVATV